MSKVSLPHYHGENGREECLKEQLDKPENFQAVADIFKLLDDIVAGQNHSRRRRSKL